MIDPGIRAVRLGRRNRFAAACLMGALTCGVALLPQARSLAQSPDRFTPVVKAIRRAEPAVVNIQGNKTITVETASATGEPAKQTVNGMGTGVIIDPRGYIVTNLHVVQGVPQIEVTLADGRTSIARMINHDPNTDLALIKIDVNRDLPVIVMGTSCDLMLGEPVIAIGNPFGYHHTATQGIISALHRNIPVNGTQEYRDLIQTSADINPGNSGGPLLNIDGKMIGINVAVRVGAQGIGFAIPVDAALDVMANLVAASQNVSTNHGLVVTEKNTGESGQIFIKSVSKSSSAMDAGLAIGDRIDSVNGTAVHSRLDLELALVGQTRGEEIELEVDRDGTTLTKSIALSANAVSNPRSVAKTRTEPEIPIATKAWETIGIRLVSIPASTKTAQGGLKVVEVRRDSPAAREQIQAGDILVGLLSWHTSTWEDLAWILSRQEFQSSPSANFYIQRGSKTHVVAITPTRRTVR